MPCGQPQLYVQLVYKNCLDGLSDIHSVKNITTTETQTTKASRVYATDGSYPCLYRKNLLLFPCCCHAPLQADRPRTGRPRVTTPHVWYRGELAMPLSQEPSGVPVLMQHYRQTSDRSRTGRPRVTRPHEDRYFRSLYQRCVRLVIGLVDCRWPCDSRLVD